MTQNTKIKNAIPAASLVAGILLLTACAALSTVDSKSTRLKSLFGSDITVTEMSTTGNDTQPTSAKAVWKIEKAGHAVGYGLRLHGQTRSGSFRAFVVTDADLVIRDLRVERYLGTRGGEIRRDSFAKQFHGKTPRSRLSVGEDIDAVTGATLSSRSLATAVSQSLKWLKQHIQRTVWLGLGGCFWV